ncbi:unnamed protein product [Calypogeia fissa]
MLETGGGGGGGEGGEHRRRLGRGSKIHEPWRSGEHWQSGEQCHSSKRRRRNRGGASRYSTDSGGGPAQDRGQIELNCTHQHSKWQSASNRRGPLQWVSRSEHRGEVPPVTGKVGDTPALKQVVQGH